jgi:hypothetical protein
MDRVLNITTITENLNFTLYQNQIQIRNLGKKD